MHAEPLRTVVIEDERLAREELCGLLRQSPEVALIGEAGDLASARRLLQRTQPELMFLDIQLGDGSGFDLLDSDTGFDGRTVFVTAYEAFALRAFEVNALDYLLKPVQQDRLHTALARARASAAPSSPALHYDDYVFLRLGQGSAFVPLASILAITADGDYTIVHTAEGHAHLVLKPLKQWQARLPANVFVRIHRSTIVNLRKVHKLECWFNHGYRVFVDGLRKPLTMSRRYRHRLRDRFG